MRRSIISHGSMIKVACVSAALSAPLLEGREAIAQPTPAVASTVNVPYQVTGPNGYNITLNRPSDSSSIPAYFVSTNPPVINSAIRMDGPGTLTLRVYPIIGTDTARPTRPYPLRYTVDGAPAEQNLSTSINSGFTHPTLRPNTEIGSPSEVRITVSGVGPHTIIPTFPTACFEVVSSTAPAPVARVSLPIGPVLPVQPPVVVRQPPVVVPATPPFALPSLPRFVAEARASVLFAHSGSQPNAVTSLDVRYHRAINARFGFDVGAYIGLDFSGLNLADRQTSLTLPWGTAIGGITYQINSANRLALLGFAGYQHGSSETVGTNRTVSDSDGGVALGLRATYQGRYVAALLEVSNRSLDVGRVEVGYRVPKSLTTDAHPVISATARLLRSGVFDPTTQTVNLSSSGNAAAFGVSGTLPFGRFGSVVPVLRLGAEYATTGALGISGGLGVDFF